MKVRIGFVSNSSSSSFLCLGVSKSSIIQECLATEKMKKVVDEEYSYYEKEGYGSLNGRFINYYGSSGNGWQAAGLSEEETKQVLDTNTLPEARKWFKKMAKEEMNIDIAVKDIDLHFGEASSE